MHRPLSGLCKYEEGDSIWTRTNEAYHFAYSRFTWTRTKHTTSSVLGIRSQENPMVDSWSVDEHLASLANRSQTNDTYSLRANTFSSVQPECSFCSKFSVLLSQIYKTNDKQYPDNYLGRLIDLGCCFRVIKAWGPRSTASQKRMQRSPLVLMLILSARSTWVKNGAKL